jgi:hypothetical protein
MNIEKREKPHKKESNEGNPILLNSEDEKANSLNRICHFFFVFLVFMVDNAPT